VKLRNYFEVLGLRGKPRRYGHAIKTIEVQGQKEPIRYAQWQHPKEKPKSVDPAEVREYEKFVGKGDLCIDIGAHTGDSVFPMALAVGKGGMVIALEPNPYVYPLLEQNARLNRGLVNIQPIMAAAAPSYGFMTFEYSDSGFCNGGRHEGMTKMQHGHAFDLEIVTINLAEELKSCFAAELPSLKLIKVDAEGYDYQVLKSLEEIIRQFHPYIKAEMFGGLVQAQRQQMVNFLSDHGYTVYKTNADADLLGIKMTDADVMRWKHYDIFCVPAEKTS
jgi:FkbM family methyltransferase